MKYLFLLLGLWLMAATVQAQSLAIAHDAIPFAVRGQPLTLKAKVTGAEEPQSVTLYYALFRDAAPFRVPMKSTGLGYYVGTIESSVVAGVDSFSYYIEAQDKNGVITETPWYEVPFRRAESKPEVGGMPMPAPAGPAAPAPVIAAPVERGAKDQEESSWKTPALIAGGAALVLGGAYAISQSGGGGGDSGGTGGGGDVPADPQGTYAGTVNTCLTSTGGVTACESSAMSIVIDANNVVFSESIQPGQQLTGSLNGSAFTLVSVLNNGGTNRTINFDGNVVGTKILGSVSGSSSDGGVYSGSFSANKQ